MPIALTNIGWKTYIINGSWDIVTLVLIVRYPTSSDVVYFQSANADQAVYWVETKGKTLEEIDAIFEGEKHSSVPDIEDIRTGKKTVDVTQIELELHDEIGLKSHEA
jgi:hypothetical protein